MQQSINPNDKFMEKQSVEYLSSILNQGSLNTPSNKVKKVKEMKDSFPGGNPHQDERAEIFKDVMVRPLINKFNMSEELID